MPNMESYLANILFRKSKHLASIKIFKIGQMSNQEYMASPVVGKFRLIWSLSCYLAVDDPEITIKELMDFTTG